MIMIIIVIVIVIIIIIILFHLFSLEKWPCPWLKAWIEINLEH